MRAVQRDLDHSDLVTRISSGDTDAEAELYRVFSVRVFKMLQYRSGDAEVARDLTHDVFGYLIEKLRAKRLRDAGQLPAYVHQTALNVWLGYIRREHRRKTDPMSDILDGLPTDPAEMDEVCRDEEANAVYEMLQILKERDREILRRTYLLDQDKAHVCDALSLSSEHFDRVIYRAKKRLRQIAETRFASLLDAGR